MTIRGWQRAGALVRFFAPYRGAFADPRLATPDRIFASRPCDHAPSRRSLLTVTPLADFLGLPVNLDYSKGREAALAKAVPTLDGVTLIAWSHNKLPELASLISERRATVPRTWPTDRFDVVWVFDSRHGEWIFHQVPQLLLAGDEDTPIAPGGA